MQRVEELLAHQINTRSAALALRDSIGIVWTYADVQRAQSSAQDLLSLLGVRAGDRVVMLVENCAAAAVFMFAAWGLGAVAVPVNARQTATEVDRIIDHAKPAGIVAFSAASPDAAAHATRLGIGETSGDFGVVHACSAHASTPYADPRLAVLLYTTGTTGTPKGVMLSHENLIFGGRASAALREMTHADLVYGVLPITHVFGLASVVVAATSAGTPVALEARFSAPKLLCALHGGVTLLSAVPQMHALLMQHTKEQGQSALGSDRLRYVSSGAAPLDPTWKRKAEAFYGVAIQNGYGMTETTAGVCATRNEIGSPDISVGAPLPGVEIKIDDTAKGGAAGRGEILTRGPHIMMGYYNNRAETDKVLDGAGWMRTGDLGQIDDGGHLHILGRSKELIIHGGFNVYPPEVEAALNDHPQVIQSAVIGRMSQGDEEVLAFVQIAPNDPLSAKELAVFVAKRLAGYKRPAQIVLTQQLPAAPTGKILKHRLLDVFAADLA